MPTKSSTLRTPDSSSVTVSLAIASTSISSTGSVIAISAVPNARPLPAGRHGVQVGVVVGAGVRVGGARAPAGEGLRAAPADGARWPAPAPRAGTHWSTKRASSGPATITVGIATRMPNSRVRPRSAESRPIAVSGPGCGGTSPCSTESPARAGMPTFISDTPVRRDTMITTGTSSTTPTSKNSGRPRIAAIAAIIQGSPPGPDLADQRRDDPVGAAGVLEDLADHRAERDQDADGPGGRPEAGDEAGHDVAGRHRGDGAEHRRAEHEGQERVHLRPRDEQDDGEDAEDARGDQLTVAGSGDGGVGEVEGAHREWSFRSPRAFRARSRTWAAVPSLVTSTPGSSASSGSRVASWLGSREAGM